jgi:SnoaL-like domain
MKADDLEKKVKDLTKTVKKMKTKERALEEKEAIKKLQRAYGYYLEHWEEDQIVELFSHNPEVSVEINDSGLYKGYEAVKNSFNFADHYTAYGGIKKAPGEFLHILIPLSGIVDLEPGGKRAKGRWYGFGLIAQRRAGKLQAIISCGIWENEYIKEAKIWKILKLRWATIIASPLDEGWVKTPYLGNPPHKDAPTPEENINFAPYPSGYIFPYHYKNPVTGK